ncbi:low molecular weight protein-tyrosine-phosphatase [Thalassotalea fusca]
MKLNYKDIKSVLFVCMGNICRSPTAEAVFIKKASEAGLSIKIDSAGTIGAHAKESPDHRAQKVGEQAGYSFKGLKARKVTVEDFEKFDLILAMDEKNHQDLIDIAPSEHHEKVQLFLQHAENFDDMEVPDPYYGGAGGFRLVLAMAEDASDGLISKMR